MQRVCVILVNYRQSQKTLSCLRALEKGTIKPDCTYVIDNAYTPQSEKFFRKQSFSISVNWIYNRENRGFAAACNQGIREAQKNGFEGFVWLLNNDTEPAPTALENILKKAESTGAGITGSLIKKADGKFSGGVCQIHPKFATVRRPASAQEKDFDYVEGSSFLISCCCLKKTGFLSEEYFLYFEESDYCLRAKKNGFTLAWATDSVIFHDIGSSTGSEIAKGKVPYFIDCLMIRNRIHFALKNGFDRDRKSTRLNSSH